MNPLHIDPNEQLEMNSMKGSTVDIEKPHNEDKDPYKSALGQMAIPWRQKVHTFDPEFFKCDKKIVKYDSKALNDYRVSYNFCLYFVITC